MYHKKLAEQCGFSQGQMRGVLLHCSNDVILHLLEARAAIPDKNNLLATHPCDTSPTCQGPAPAVNQLLTKLNSDENKPLAHDSLRVILSTEDIAG